jgi:hypothetical protein
MGTGGYQSPQRSYSSGSGYYQPQNRGTSGYTGGNYYQRAQGGYQSGNYSQAGYQQQSRQAASGARPSADAGDGFYLSGGLSRQYAQWNFDMKSTGSVLNYSDVAWNVLDVRGGYRAGNIVIDGGLQYGMQSGSTTMTDDDITNGGMITSFQGTDSSNNPVTFVTNTRVLSMGEASKGSMLGINAGIGLANKLGFGKVKITPSVGYRMFNYKLNTSNNHGMSVESNWCRDNGDGSKHCPSIVWVWDGDPSHGASMTTGNPDVPDGSGWWQLPSGSGYVSNGDSYSFSQTGKTHVYDVSWNGPYAAVDIESDLGGSSRVDARIELGLPGYNSVGDQPYRPDWQHPKSVEDSKGMFGATHLGLLANWTTMLGGGWGFTVGLTYDYYNVKGADADTYISGDYYMKAVNATLSTNYTIQDAINYVKTTPNPNEFVASVVGLYESCDNSWTCTMKSEINSFYRSIGVRIGLAGKF